jgi:hypothetical protein
MKKLIIAAAMLAFTAPAFAGGVTVAEDDESKLELSAKFFVNFTKGTTEGNGLLSGNGAKQADSVGVALDRAYLTAKYQFDDVWSMRLTTDTTIDAGLSKQTNVYIKYAYLRGKFSDAFAVDAGVIATPWIGYENKLNTHRYVYKSFTDFEKFDDSADAGVGASGKLSDGLFQYAVAGVNGGGYSEITKTATIDFNSRLGFYPIEGLTFDVQFRDGYKGSKTWVAGLGNTPGTKYRLMQGMITYGIGNNFRIAANYISQNADDKTTGLTTKSTGYDAWGYYNFNSDFGVFGQYDYLKDKKDGTAVEAKVTRYTAGLEYTARKNVRFSLVAKAWKITNALFNPGAEIKNATYGIYSEVKF